MELVFIWLMCAIVAAVIGAAKGRSGFGWLLLGGLLGIFAVLIVACLPSLKTPHAYKVVGADGTESMMLPVLPDRPKLDGVAVVITLGVVFGGIWLLGLFLPWVTGVG